MTHFNHNIFTKEFHCRLFCMCIQMYANVCVCVASSVDWPRPEHPWNVNFCKWFELQQINGSIAIVCFVFNLCELFTDCNQRPHASPKTNRRTAFAVNVRLRRTEVRVDRPNENKMSEAKTDFHLFCLCAGHGGAERKREGGGRW